TLQVIWREISEPTYDKDKVGRYVFKGEIIFEDDVINPNKLMSEYWVNLLEKDEIDEEVIPGQDPKQPGDGGSDDEQGLEENDVKVTVESGEKSGMETKQSLPKTATNIYTLIFSGLLLIVIGAGVYFMMKRRRVS